MTRPLDYPFDLAALMRKRRSLRAELTERARATDPEVRVALLGGSTTSELKEFLELFLLDAGFRPVLYETQFGKYEEEVLLDDADLRAFRPRIAVVYTTWVNARVPEILEADDAVADRLRGEVARFEAIWSKLVSMGCAVIQNNFDVPLERSLGNLDGARPFGRSHFLRALNLELTRAASREPRVVLHDIDHLSSLVGLERWHDKGYWHSYRLAVSPAGTVPMAHSIAAIVRAILGRSKKCLVLDLDNTLWGGVIGDDGLGGLRLGEGTPEGEAFRGFQRYCLELKKRGVVLAVCSKNEPQTAQEGFTHPDSVLALTDFAAFKASWNPKHEAILEISHELNLGLDSFVFVDDNPAEREIVRAQLPMVATPDIGDDPARYVEILDRQLYFEPFGVSAEDTERARYYAGNVDRNLAQATFTSYADFLDSLEMVAEIGAFHPTYMDRIAQLTNKTNQFNLTTRRYTLAELEEMRKDPRVVALYGRLADKFGDNGLVTVVLGKQIGDELIVDLWLMSCRVLKRDMEHAMLDELVARASARGVRRIRGEYVRTARNGLVAEHYPKLGFDVDRSADNGIEYVLSIDDAYTRRNTHVRVEHPSPGSPAGAKHHDHPNA